MFSFRLWAVSLSLIVLFATLNSCGSNRRETHITRSYYFWRNGSTTTEEQQFLKQHEIRKIYARLLDVDWDDIMGAVPIAGNQIEQISFSLKQHDSFEVNLVPVVFITNKTFERIDSSDIPLLAQRIIRRCLPSYDSIDQAYERNNYLNQYGGPISPRELQFDCDWTVKTATRYFQFLREIKKRIRTDAILISATIRLHQYRYPQKTGVPPVDRGMLMVYNLSDPKQYGTQNSIFEKRTAEPYFSGKEKYPLPLDMALPAWSWCIVYRNQKFYQIENGLDEPDLKSLSFLQRRSNGLYRVTSDTVYRGLFLRPGDEIKAEGIDETTLSAAAQLARKAVNSDSFSISLFELSENEIKNYNRETIRKVYSAFH
jgi:hypothetical protein